jgi:RHS repeat-associated protein
LTAATHFYVVISSNGVSVNSATVTVAVGPPPDVNYIRTRTISIPGIMDMSSADALSDPREVQQQTQYFDGLGRVIQTVTRQITPNGKDLVTPVVYDSIGRESVHYLPYVSESSDGNFKYDEIAEQGRFYSTQFSGEQFYYGKVEFDSSPLNRSLNTFSAGTSWVGSSRGTSAGYLVNTASDSIRIWTIDSTIGSIPATNSMYANATLYKHTVTDEDGHQSIEYVDLQGKVILKKVQLWPSPATGHSGWLNTYYIYDDMDNLRFVIQPKAVDWLKSNNWSFASAGGDTVAYELCFRYEYDNRKRMVIKKLPGAGESWMIYDMRDRLIMSQDSVIRRQSHWLVTRYDGLNRIDSTVFITDNTHYKDRQYHQNLANSTPVYPNLNLYSGFQLYTQLFYDNYDWTAGIGMNSSLANNYTNNPAYFITNYNSSPAYALPLIASLPTRGLLTGNKSRILGTNNPGTFIPVVKFYDDRGRIIQTQSVNYTGGMDTTTTQYDFNGNLLRIYSNVWKGTNYNPQNKIEGHTVLTKMDYDAAYRMKHIWKNLDNSPTDQLIDSLLYNELGQLRVKYLGNALDSLVYDYNLRGWLKGINLNYLRGLTSNYYGMEISYDNPQSVIQSGNYQNAYYNGNIAGVMWKSAGDAVDRKYDFSYDNISRLINAAYQDDKNGTFSTSAMDFSVSGVSYDANGNLLSMSQQGFKIGNAGAPIDQLTYRYQGNSNKIKYVIDGVNDPNTTLGDFHYPLATKDSTDYTYDGNGNIASDKNKNISVIGYNYLNLPSSIALQNALVGTISNFYDADGHLHAKVTIDAQARKSIKATYIGDFVYSAADTSIPYTYGGLDTLQYVKTEEGRARWAWHASTNSYGWEYDFFEKDHLGSTRVILTQEKDTAHYLASMESKYRSTEDQLFYNIPTTNYSRASVMGYPVDTSVTNPNDSVVRLNGNGPKMGPAIILKVMSGDKVDIGVNYYYTSSSTTPGQTLSASDIITSLATGIVSLTGATHGSFSDLTGASSPLPSGLASFLNNKNPSAPGKPNAYLNWILLDNQFNYVSSYPQSGALPVGASGTQSGGALQSPLAQTGIPITKSGYLYVYVSNATPGWDVFFDNLAITHYRGPLLEENHYYPFGLSMSAISDKAIKPRYAENKFRYIGKELSNNMFSSQGIDLYDFGARMFDPQLGVWHTPDPLAEKNRRWSPYNYSYNNPLRFSDPDGMEGEDNHESGDDGDEMVKVKILYNRITKQFSMQEVSDEEFDEHSNDDPWGPKTSFSKISSAFDDGKKATSYEFGLLVETPVVGSRAIKLELGDHTVGHTFIRLTKNNDDGSSVTQTFGFFPLGGQSQNFLGDGNFLVPESVGSSFHDNTDHPWSLELTKRISENAFKNILKLTSFFEGTKYNLATNNCSTFGILAATSAGVGIGQASGTWPGYTTFSPFLTMSEGYNPASIGASIIEGKYINLDTGEKSGFHLYWSQEALWHVRSATETPILRLFTH